MIQVSLEDITVSFGDFLANDQVSVAIHKGTVHAILGENGAGKTTLMNVLYGLNQPDSGSIRIAGKRVRVADPRAAQRFGIGMIHQHFALVDRFTVTENVVLGLEPRRLQVGRRRHSQRIASLCESFGFDLDPNAPVWSLPVGVQQRVEILKLLYRDSEVLILDEPTSVLAPNEVEAFFDVLRRFRNAGKTIILITHKLGEVMQVADEITVMRTGRVVCNTKTQETEPAGLAEIMTGRKLEGGRSERQSSANADVRLVCESISARDDRGIPAVNDVTFSVRSGEILGIAGVNGNGQTELAQVITGFRRADNGRIQVDGKDIRGTSAAARKHNVRMGYVPSDRHGTSLALNHSLTDNVVMRNYDRGPYSKRGLMNRRAINRHTESVTRKYDVRFRTIHESVRFLSGGNQQKLVVGRELEDSPGVLVVDQPCQGLDVGAVESIHSALEEQRQKGVAILYISTELDDLLATCDRVAVMYRGRISGMVSVEDDADVTARIGRLMAGLPDEEQ